MKKQIELKFTLPVVKISLKNQIDIMEKNVMYSFSYR